MLVYSANSLYETKCDKFAGKVSERQFSYERWIGKNAEILWFFLYKEDFRNSKFVQSVFKMRIPKIASFCRLFSSAFPIGNYWISWTTQDWLSVWLLKPESFCQRMPRTIPSNRIWKYLRKKYLTIIEAFILDSQSWCFSALPLQNLP